MGMNMDVGVGVGVLDWNRPPFKYHEALARI
jgi:hypothetical protein